MLLPPSFPFFPFLPPSFRLLSSFFRLFRLFLRRPFSAMFGFTFVITLLAMFAYICKGLGQGTWVTSAGKVKVYIIFSVAKYLHW